MTVTVGSLCTGIGGLDHSLTIAGLDTHPVFVSDIDPGACAWLEANSTAPNLGDFTALDELPPVDILTAGFPCQPLSSAGQRKGLNDDRWLFDDICRLIGRMETRPVVFLENVPGLLTANGGHAMAAVVYGLAAIGYRLDYGTLEAAAVGAPHRRRRWWGIATPENTDSEPRSQWWISTPAETESRRPRPDTGGRNRAHVADTNSNRRPCGDTQQLRPRHQQTPDFARSSDRFGQYAATVTRWEHVTGRPAPDPTTDGRLSPHFVEWMMGYPAGWVTDTLTNRRQALHALGNAVVPQCAAAAFTQLSAR
jgi:DNA (cytosine-5)-methyltransferase 1